MKNTILIAHNVEKKYGNNTLWSGVNFSIKEGEIVGFVGNNGTGKTTLMKGILGLSPLTSGYFTYLGEKKYLNNQKTIKSIGYLLETPLYPYLNASETLKLMAQYEGAKIDNQHIDNLLEQVRLKNDKKKVKDYSFGMAQKLRLAISLMFERKLLILDEPTVGLDPSSVEEFLDIIRIMTHDKGTSVLLSSHQLDTIAPLCERYLYISNNEIHESKKIYFYNGAFHTDNKAQDQVNKEGK